MKDTQQEINQIYLNRITLPLNIVSYFIPLQVSTCNMSLFLLENKSFCCRYHSFCNMCCDRWRTVRDSRVAWWSACCKASQACSNQATYKCCTKQCCQIFRFSFRGCERHLCLHDGLVFCSVLKRRIIALMNCFSFLPHALCYKY